MAPVLGPVAGSAVEVGLVAADFDGGATVVNEAVLSAAADNQANLAVAPVSPNPPSMPTSGNGRGRGGGAAALTTTPAASAHQAVRFHQLQNGSPLGEAVARAGQARGT